MRPRSRWPCRRPGASASAASSKAIADGEVRLFIDNPEGGTEKLLIGVPFAEIGEAKLVLTDALIEAAKPRRPGRSMADGSDWTEDSTAATRTDNRFGRQETLNMAEAAVSANRLELLQIADAVAREKSIDKSVVLAAMEDAIQRAAKSRYGAENEIRAEIDAQDRRDAAQPAAAGGREGRERSDRDQPRRGAAGAIRRRPSATISPSRCRRSNSAASPRRTPSR